MLLGPRYYVQYGWSDLEATQNTHTYQIPQQAIQSQHERGKYTTRPEREDGNYGGITRGMIFEHIKEKIGWNKHTSIVTYLHIKKERGGRDGIDRHSTQ